MRPRQTGAPRPLQQGLTLVELMVAITAGLLLLAGIVQILISTKANYRLQEAMARMQEDGRVAMHFLSEDIRKTDYWGCQPDISDMTNGLNSGGEGYINIGNGGVEGTEGGADPDTLTLRGGAGNGATVVDPFMPTPSSALFVSADADLEDGDILIVSDCTGGDVFQATNVSTTGSKTTVVHNPGGSATPGNASGDLSKVYRGDASIYKLQEITYSIQNGASGEPALFRSENGVAQELVEGVEDMQILYGEDTTGDGTADRYVQADAAGLDMEAVVSIRVILTLRSADFLSLDDSGADRRIRRYFTTTVALRNRTG